MQTLGEIGAFVNRTQNVSMREVGNDVPVLTTDEQTSMRAMILALQNLPSVTLQVEVVGGTAGVVPFWPLFRVFPTEGVTLLTTFAFLLQNGEPIPGVSLHEIRGNWAGDFRHVSFGHPGVFHLRVTRIGTGPITLEQTLELRAVAQPGQPPPPPPPPSPVIDNVTKIQASGAFQVKGHAFLKERPVHIRVTNTSTFAGDFFHTNSDHDGKIDTIIPIPVQVPGTILAFSANDERRVPPAVDHTELLWSNTVSVPA